MMKPAFTLITRRLLLGALALTMAGCIDLAGLKQPPMQTAYYVLEYEPAAIAAEPVPAVVRVNRFTAAPLFSTTGMIYKKKSFQTEAYVYHRWHTAPADMVSHLLARDMERSGLFPAVFGPTGSTLASYAVEGHIETFLEDDTADPWQAELRLTIVLTDLRATGDGAAAVLFQKSYQATEPCPRNHPRAFAEAMSRAMANVSREIITDICQAIGKRENSRKSPGAGNSLNAEPKDL
ncbi:MAG: ABC-type transport auxiliary lipoprotein family protein [Thermodesulfobacteriota bacterium]